MTDSSIGGPDETAASASASAEVATGLLMRVAATPAAMALASLFLGLASMFVLAPAEQIGELDTTSQLGIPLPGLHSIRISAAIRLAVSLVALLLAAAAVRRRSGSPAASPRPELSSGLTALAGAAAIVATVAIVLNFAALADALLNGPVYTVYNHIGS